MIELRDKMMLSYLKQGLSKGYALMDGVKEGTVKTLISDELIEGKTYRVDLINDERVNDGVPYVIVMMKESINRFDNWQYYVSKGLDV